MGLETNWQIHAYFCSPEKDLCMPIGQSLNQYNCIFNIIKLNNLLIIIGLLFEHWYLITCKCYPSLENYDV